ncbi:hypothetical protein R84981_003020 [Carnimonas sp. R-84981]|uniref:hypothetical protein n=1 Tax=Carnimonas bestiolae TaxID=3402172 RepID=UPI003EDCA7F0
MSELDVRNGIEWFFRESGMLRDYFAGQVIANQLHYEDPKRVARYAYEVADAMMEARKK